MGHGWETAPTQIVLVVGPPGAGKGKYVAEHAEHGDLIVDYDAIAKALGGTTNDDNPLHTATNAARNAVLTTLRRGEAGVARAWIISANPAAEALLPHHRRIVVDPGRDVVTAAAAPTSRTLVDDWYDKRAGRASRSDSSPSRQW